MEARSVAERRGVALAGSQLHGCMAETQQAWKHRNQVNDLKLLFYSELTILDCQETSLPLNVFPLRIHEHNVFPDNGSC